MNANDWLGFSGVFLILLGYFLNIIGVLSNKNLYFILLNLIGASLACYASYLLEFIPFVVLEGIWALISLIALVKLYTKSHDRLKES